MRLHAAKVPKLASEMLSALTRDGDIECESPSEVQADIDAVLAQYVRDEAEITEKARDIIASRGLASTELGREKRRLAEQRGLKIDDEAVDYLLDQLIEMLMHSTNVAEVYSEDVVLRRKLRDPLRREIAADADLEKEVRGRLKHVKEGSALWEIEYRRMMDDIKRRKGL